MDDSNGGRQKQKQVLPLRGRMTNRGRPLIGEQTFSQLTLGAAATAKGEIQGSLHCAADDKTVHCFGRDDVVLLSHGN
ncbi:MAG: hypothetical protein ACRD3K_10730, partial [Edaphobacter sp.]